MPHSTIFISYSHADEEWKNRLVKQLNVLAFEGYFEVWDDRRIAAGDNWYPAIEAAINTASVAILLISEDFLTSSFIRGEEVPRLLRRRAEQGLRVIPLIIWPCAWQRLNWLSGMQARPTDGRPLAKGNEYQIRVDLAALVEEVDDLLRPLRQGHGSSSPHAPGTRTHDFHVQLGSEQNQGLLTPTERLEGIVPGVNPYVTGPSLEANSPVFFGRVQVLHEILATLRRPGKPGCVSIVGERRMGKSSLLNQVYRALSCEPGLVSIHATVQNWNQTSQQHFFNNLYQAIITATGPASGRDVIDYPSFRDFVHDLVQTHAYRFVLILDEFEGMASNPNFNATFFTNMRALGERPEFGFGYVTASRRSLSELSRDHSIESSAFWNIFSHKVIGLLTEQESQSLVREPLGRSLPPEKGPDIDSLWQNAIYPFTGGHPALIQIVTSTYWSGLDGGYDPDPLGIETDIRNHLEDLWYRRSREELGLLIHAASGRALPPSSLVTDLMQRGLLTREGKPFSDSFTKVITESLPIGKSLADGANDLAYGGQRAAQLFEQIETSARGPGRVDHAFERPREDWRRMHTHDVAQWVKPCVAACLALAAGVLAATIRCAGAPGI